MNQRYNLALNNLTALVNKTKRALHPDDQEQLAEDLFYLRLYDKQYLPKSEDIKRSRT